MTSLLKFYRYIFLPRLNYIKKNDTQSISDENINNDEYNGSEKSDELRGEEIVGDIENTRDYIEPLK
jgi:hypothetical protein